MFNFIVNPIAGNNRAIKNMKTIAKYLIQKNIPFNVYPTDKIGTAKKIASELERLGAKSIIAVGGDGTFSEVLNGLINPSSVNLGFIPSGTGNDFAYALNLEKNPIKAMNVVLRNNVKKIDYIQGSGFRTLNVIGSGLDVEVLREYNRGKNRNKLKYVTSLFKVLKSFDFYPLKVYTDGNLLTDSKFLLVAGCNGTRFGGSIKVSPHSDVSDGKINLVLVKEVDKKKIIKPLFEFMRGKHLDKSYATEVLCETLKIEGPATKFINSDGEILENKEFYVKIVKGGLNVYL